MKSMTDRLRRRAWGATIVCCVGLICGPGLADAQEGAPLVDGLGGPLDIGELQDADNIDLDEAFPGGLRFYESRVATAVINGEGILSFERRACCYEGDPLPWRFTLGANTGRIHVYEAQVTNLRPRTPDEPGWYIYSHIRPHMGDAEPGRLVATWHPMPDRRLDRDDVEYVSVQAILTAVGNQGDFDLELRYHQCEWSEPGPNPGLFPVMGFDADLGLDGPAWMWPGSLSDDARKLCQLSNVREPGVFRFQFRDGEPFGCGPQTAPFEGEGRCDDGNHLPGDGCSPACYVEPDVDGDGVFEAPSPFSVDPDGVYDACADLDDPRCTRDTDMDGVPDDNDNCDDDRNPDQRDYDNDGVGDVCDVNADGDALFWPADRPGQYPDSCPFLPSDGTRQVDPDERISELAQSPDSDLDGMGDACDPDDDGDGVLDCGEDGICHPEDNGYNDDADDNVDESGECAVGDPLYERCVTGRRDAFDNDADGFVDEYSEDVFPRQDYPGPDVGEDNCRLVYNPDQADLDGDGIGDACDPDVDGDGIETCVDGICGREFDFRDNDGDGRIDEPGECADCPVDVDRVDQDRDGFVDEGFEPDDFDPPAGPVDVCPLIPDPEQLDSNGDGRGDLCADDDRDGHDGFEDNCVYDSNPDQSDLDQDGLGDVCDPDDDGDGVDDADDNCPRDANPMQADYESDGQGDVCDGDDDNDGVADLEDTCPMTFQESQVDTDGDGDGDACDDDDDGDGILDADDICPVHADPQQADLDADGLGDACDADDDGDGIDDGDDLCPRDGDPAQRDLDGDRVGDVCDPDDDGDGTPDAADVCPDQPDDQRDTDGDGDGDACDADDDGDGIEDERDVCPTVADGQQGDLDGDGRGDACDDTDDRLFVDLPPAERCARLVEMKAPTVERLRHCPPASDGCRAAPGTGGPAPWGWLLVLGGGLIGRRRR